MALLICLLASKISTRDNHQTQQTTILFVERIRVLARRNYTRVAKSYQSSKNKTDNPVETIRISRNPHMEAERQTLLIIGEKILEQTNDEKRTLGMLYHIADQNELDVRV
jgi:hypothetical protein